MAPFVAIAACCCHCFRCCRVAGGAITQRKTHGQSRQRAEQAIVMAVKQHSAQVVLLPELWCGPYFCQSQEASLMELADPAVDNALIARMQTYAKKYQVVLPLSFYERCNNVLYNSVVVVDSDGTLCNGGACYRKSHIPDGTGE